MKTNRPYVKKSVLSWFNFTERQPNKEDKYQTLLIAYDNTTRRKFYQDEFKDNNLIVQSDDWNGNQFASGRNVLFWAKIPNPPAPPLQIK